jgi:hypothetical protein
VLDLMSRGLQGYLWARSRQETRTPQEVDSSLTRLPVVNFCGRQGSSAFGKAQHKAFFLSPLHLSLQIQ